MPFIPSALSKTPFKGAIHDIAVNHSFGFSELTDYDMSMLLDACQEDGDLCEEYLDEVKQDYCNTSANWRDTYVVRREVYDNFTWSPEQEIFVAGSFNTNEYKMVARCFFYDECGANNSCCTSLR